jgi:hypothetical protein
MAQLNNGTVTITVSEKPRLFPKLTPSLSVQVVGHSVVCDAAPLNDDWILHS